MAQFKNQNWAVGAGITYAFGPPGGSAGIDGLQGASKVAKANARSFGGAALRLSDL